jgi:uncharacterized integral membrane protein
VAGALLGAAVLLLVMQNTQTVHLQWLIFDAHWPLWMAIGVGLATGLLLGALLLGGLQHARRRRKDSALAP